MINSNLPPILHCFRDIAFDMSKIAIFAYPVAFNPTRMLQTTDGRATKSANDEHYGETH